MTLRDIKTNKYRIPILFMIISAYALTQAATTPNAAKKLNFIWRSREKTVNINRISSSQYLEYVNNNREGQFYYIPADQGPTDIPLYQLYDSSYDDFMTSTQIDEGGYSWNATLGYAHTTQLPGTVEITRWYDSSSDDHAIKRPSETLSGYTSQNLPDAVYGYPRYGLYDDTDMLSLSGGGVTIKSNLAAGGAIFSWQHNGKEYVNIYDYGRQMQSAYFAPHTEGETTWAINPTEAGSRHTFLAYGEDRRQGSPLLTAYNDGLKQVTRSIPVDFQNEYFGGDQYHPILWPTARLGKDITLDYNGMGAVAKYESHLVVPADIGAGAWMEIPTTYMTGDFNRFWTYNAETSTLTLVTPSSNQGGLYQAGPDFDGIHYGGVIISLPGDNYAMGVYTVSLEKGGSMTHMNLYNFTGIWPSGGSPMVNATAKWAVGTGGFGFDDDYEYIFTSWVISGTLSEVTAHMDSLYAQGVVGSPRAIPLDPNARYGREKREDAVIFRPSTGIWQGSHNKPAPDYITGEITTQSLAFGSSADTPFLGDLDGDGLDDIVCIQPVAGHYEWYANHTADTDNNGASEIVGGAANSSLNNFGTVSGSAGNFLADITGDGIDDAVTINVGLNWYCKPSTEGVGFDAATAAQGPSQWGLPGDIPLVGDFNGDGYADTAVWRPSNAYWYIKKSGPGGLGTGETVQGAFGLPNSDDIPMVGDVNGDGRTDGIIIRPSGSDLTWISGFADATGKVDWASGGGHNDFVTFGLTTDTPVTADINGDGRVDIGYIRDSGNGELLWKFALTTETGQFTAFAMVSAIFGETGDIPLIGQLDYAILGDVNDDLSINLLDVAQISAAWLSQTDDPNWDKDCDIDLPENGIIDIQDLKVIIESWLGGI